MGNTAEDLALEEGDEDILELFEKLKMFEQGDPEQGHTQQAYPE